MSQLIADVARFVLRRNVEADVVSQEVGEEEELHGGLCDLLVLMAIPQEQQD